MEDSPLPRPTNLWPDVPVATTHRLPGRDGVYLEVAPQAAAPLLEAISRSVSREMYCAGEWAARTGSVQTEKGFFSPQAISRRSAGEAARLFSLYTALHAAVRPSGPLDLAPDALRASAAESYRQGFLAEREYQRKHGVAFNDGLYDQTQAKTPGQGTKFHP